MGTSGNRDCQRASMSALKDFTDDAFTISAGSFFQNGTARMYFYRILRYDGTDGVVNDADVCPGTQ